MTKDRESHTDRFKDDVGAGTKVIRAMVKKIMEIRFQEGYRQQLLMIMGISDANTRRAALEELDWQFGIPTGEDRDKMAAEMLASEAPGGAISIIGLAGSAARVRDKLVIDDHVDRAEATSLVLEVFPSVCKLDRHVAEKDLATAQSMVNTSLEMLKMSLGSMANRYQEDPQK